MRRFLPWLVPLALFVVALPLLARERWSSVSCEPSGYVSLEVVGDERGPLSLFWPSRSGRWESHFFQGTVEARQGERYRLRLRNLTGGRIGLVVAVDGRNIISGERSYLRPSESMYVLNPSQTGVLNGWRTGLSRENRFYFTHAGDSYAGAWGDTSRLGTIEVAVFMERPRPRRYEPPDLPYYDEEKSKAAAPSSESGVRAERSTLQESRPGTGYGEEIYSRVSETDFEPEAFPAERQVVKYEWPGSRRYEPTPAPRYLPEDDRSDFAPPPPGR